MARLMVSATMLVLLALTSTTPAAAMAARNPVGGMPVPRKWKLVGAGEQAAARKQLLGSQPDALEVVFELRRRNAAKMTEIVERVSDPESKDYGNHLSLEQLRELIAPAAGVREGVRAWLAQGGATQVRENELGDSVKAVLSHAAAEKLLGVQFEAFEHAKSGDRVLRATGAGRVPAKIADAVELVVGVAEFPPERTTVGPVGMRKVGPNDQTVVPSNMWSSYKIPHPAPMAPSGTSNGRAFFQAVGQYVSQSDLTQFCQSAAPSLSAATCNITGYIGKNQPSEPGIESSLDCQYQTGISQVPDQYVFSYPGGQTLQSFCNALSNWATDMLSSKSKGINQVSMSYGLQADSIVCGASQQERLCDSMKQMGAMGKTIIIASGDSGAGWDGSSQLNPSYPASCPWVTATGATRYMNGNSGEEEAVFEFGSGGGFSRIFDRPSYQEADVTKYLNTNTQLPPASYWNRTGRATPDVAAIGQNVEIVWSGSSYLVGGTSCSAPEWAGVVTTLNAERLKAGKTLGFLNPLIYKHPEAFTDITVGNNGYSRQGGQTPGFYCQKGWDPVTGLGTPLVDKLIDVVKGLNQMKH